MRERLGVPLLGRIVSADVCPPVGLGGFHAALPHQPDQDSSLRRSDMVRGNLDWSVLVLTRTKHSNEAGLFSLLVFRFLKILVSTIK